MKDLLRGFAPEEVLDEVDVERIEAEKTDFYTEHFQKRDGDMLLKLPRRGGGDAYLWFLLEFQVRSEWFMSARVCTYLALLHEHLIRTLKLRTGDALPPVFAMVLYHGKDRWSAPTTLGGLIGLPPRSSLWVWQPQVRFLLLQEQETNVTGKGDNLAGLLIKLNQCRTGQDFANVIRQMGQAVSRDEDRDLRRLLVEWIVQVLAKKHKVKISAQDMGPLLEGRPMGLEHHIDGIVEDFKRMGHENGRNRSEDLALRTVLEARFGVSERWQVVIEASWQHSAFEEVLRLASTSPDEKAFWEGVQGVFGWS